MPKIQRHATRRHTKRYTPEQPPPVWREFVPRTAAELAAVMPLEDGHAPISDSVWAELLASMTGRVR